jgi:hypothetical protein
MELKMSNIDKGNSEEDYAREFGDHLEKGLKKLLEAARTYCRAIDDEAINNERFRKLCREQAPSLPPLFWRGIERVGRGQTHWKLLLGAGGTHEAKIGRLPMSVQKDICEGVKFEMLTRTNDVVKVDVRTISADQARQVFAADHIRSVAEQKAWQAEHILPDAEPPAERLPIRYLAGGKVRFLRNVVCTRTDLKRILMEL